MAMFKKKFVGLTIDDLPDVPVAKALTKTEQEFAATTVFQKAPTIVNSPNQKQERMLATRGMLKLAMTAVASRAYSLIPLEVTAESLLLNAFLVPSEITNIPFFKMGFDYYVPYKDWLYTNKDYPKEYDFIERNNRTYIFFRWFVPLHSGDGIVARQSYDVYTSGWW